MPCRSAPFFVFASSLVLDPRLCAGPETLDVGHIFNMSRQHEGDVCYPGPAVPRLIILCADGVCAIRCASSRSAGFSFSEITLLFPHVFLISLLARSLIKLLWHC